MADEWQNGKVLQLLEWKKRWTGHLEQGLRGWGDFLWQWMTLTWGMKLGVSFSRSVTQSRPTLCDPMDHSTPGLPVHHQLPEFTQIHVHWVGDAIQPSHPLLSPSPPAFNLSQHQGLFQWVSFSHQVTKVLDLQFQYQSFQWLFRTDLLGLTGLKNQKSHWQVITAFFFFVKEFL